MLTSASNLDELHILVPGPAGGGWDITARTVGTALVNNNIIKSITFTNYVGAGGWRGFQAFTKNSEFKFSVMIQSSPIIYRKVFGVYNKGFSDLRPLVALLGEYEAVITRGNSPYKSIREIVHKIQKNPHRNPVVLGSSKGSIDHIAALIILKAAGVDNLNELRFIFREGDSNAINTLLEGSGIVMFSGYSGALLDLTKKNKLTILAVSSRKKIEGVEIDTLYEQGINIEFVNWRGFFVRKDLMDQRFAIYEKALLDLTKSDEWKKILKNNGWTSMVMNSKEFDEFLRAQHKEALKIFSEFGLKF